MVRTASPVREAHLSPPRLPSPKHRPIVENGTFSTGPFVRNRREPRSGRPREAPPTQAACIRGVRGPARRMETSPAPGSLWFLSPAGKELARPQTCETPSNRKNSPVRVPPPPKTKEKRPVHPDRSFRYYPCLQPLTAFSCSCTYSVVRIFFTVPSTSSSVVLWLV